MTGATVLIHDDHFLPDEQDINWLKVAGEKGWIVLTKDSRIRYRALEKITLMKAGVAAFILTSADLKGKEMAEIFVSALPAIFKTLKKHHKPFIAKIIRNGKVTGQCWITSNMLSAADSLSAGHKFAPCTTHQN